MMDTLFSLSNLLVMPFWLLMIFAPRWRWTRRILSGLWPVAIPALLYAALVIPRLPGLMAALARPDLLSIAALLGAPDGATIAWLHFLAFDLFVGRWAYLDSREEGVPALLASPALFLILMVGPLGLLVYLALRQVWRMAQARQAAPAG
jgi:hypothetical protein